MYLLLSRCANTIPDRVTQCSCQEKITRRFLSRILKKAKMHMAVFSRFEVMRFVIQFGFRPMLNDEQAFRFQPVVGKYQLVDLRNRFKLVGRVGKHEVDSGIGLFQVFEDIGPVRADHGQLQAFSHVPDEVDAGRMLVDGIHTGGPAGGKFKRDVAGARKQVEHREVFEIYFIVQDIEQAFLGKIRGRPYR